MSYKLVANLTNVNYKKGNSGRKYIVIHYTGNTTDTATANANYFKNVHRGASAHYFVDRTQIVQVVSEQDTAWAVGKNYGSNNLFGQCTNSNSISIEMCSTGGKIADETYQNTVALTKDLMKRWNIPADRVVRHWDVCSKNCPGWDGWGADGKDASIWNRFKKDIGGTATSSGSGSSSSKPSSGGSTGSKYTGSSIVEYLNSIGVDSSFSNRKKLAAQYGISNYTGTASQNTALLNKMRNGSGSSSSASKPSSGNTGKTKLTVDGKWGSGTTKRLQQIFGTTQDGKVSNQRAQYKQPGCYDGWEWKSNPSGSSALIKAIQRKVGVTADGWIGPNTIKAMQRYWGTVQDGKISAVSSLVKAMQRWANNQ